MLKEKVNALIKTWDASGFVSIYQDDHLLYEDNFGYKDRNNGIITPIDGTYLIPKRSRYLLAILIMVCHEHYGLELDDNISKHIPKYSSENQITIRHLLFHESGLPDYFYGKIMVEKSKDASHNALTDEARYVKESQLFYEKLSFDEVLDIIKDEVLFKAGSKDYWSSTNLVFIEQIIINVMKMPLDEAIETFIFKPLGLKETMRGAKANTVSYVCMRDIHLVKAPYTGDPSLVFTTSNNDLVLLMEGLRKRKILKKETWDYGLIPNKRGEAILCYYRNGMEFYESDCLGYDFVMYIDASSQVSFLHISNEGMIFKLIDGSWKYFKAELREVLEAMVTYPKNVYLDTYHERNAWDAMDLKLAENQKEFVIDVKTTLCWALSEPQEKRIHVLMEGYRSIGMITGLFSCVQ